MPSAGELFHAAFGSPDPATEEGLSPELPVWRLNREVVGAGYFLDRYLYMFGPGLERLHEALDAWSFVVPPRTPERTILGYNMHGCIVVLESLKHVEIRILNPLTVQWWSDGNCNLISLLGRWMPQKLLPRFFDMNVYDEWRTRSGRHLKPDHILGMGVPLALDGKMTPKNFAEQDIVEYYQKAAPGYADAFASMKK